MRIANDINDLFNALNLLRSYCMNLKRFLYNIEIGNKKNGRMPTATHERSKTNF